MCHTKDAEQQLKHVQKEWSLSGMQVSILLYGFCALGDAQTHCYIALGHAWKHIIYQLICLLLPAQPSLWTGALASRVEPQLLGLVLLFLHSKITDVTFIHTVMKFAQPVTGPM